MKAYEIYTQTRVEYANYSGQTFISIFQSEGSETVSDSHGHFWKEIDQNLILNFEMSPKEQK